MALQDDREIAQWILRKGWLDRETLQNYLEEAKARPDQTLCHLLVNDGLLSAEQALEATEEVHRAAPAGPPPTPAKAPHAGPHVARHGADGHAHDRTHVRPAHGRAHADDRDREAWSHRRPPRPAWVLPACIGGGLVVVVAVGILLLGGGPKTPQDSAKAPEPAGSAETPSTAPAVPRPESVASKPAVAAPAEAPAPAAPASLEEKAAADFARIRTEGSLSDRLRLLRSLSETYKGTQAAGQALAAIAGIEKKADEAWQEKLRGVREIEARNDYANAMSECLGFMEDHPDTRACEAAREERKRIEKVLDDEWAKIEPRFRAAIAAKRFDEVKTLVAEVAKWNDVGCSSRAAAFLKEAQRLEREALASGEGEEVPPSTPPEEEPGGEIAKGPESEPEPKGGGESPPPTPTPEGERPGSTKADPEAVAKKLGVTADELKGIFATEEVSLEGDSIVLEYNFSGGVLGYGELNRELAADWLPKIGNKQTDVIRWSERAEGSIDKILHGVRVSETGRFEHKARWLPDVEVSILYLGGQQYYRQTTFLIGFRADDEPSRWIGSNFGAQACLARAAKSMSQPGAIRRAEPLAPRLPEWNRRHTMKMTLKGKTCTASLGERKNGEISDEEEFKTGRVGFLWWGKLVGTIGSVKIKGKLDPAWVREALGKKP